MKKAKIMSLAILAVSLLLLTGCTAHFREIHGTPYEIGVPVRNFQILGVVYVKVEEGEGVAYQALLRAAEKRGGNGIVNVKIDVEREVTKFFSLTLRRQETWYGSALAIKYTDENITPTESKDGKLGIPSSTTLPSLK